MNDLDDEVLVTEFIRSLKFENDVTALKEFLLPTDILSNIVTQTDSDKWVEKSHLENIVYWFFSTFMDGNLESLQIKMVSEKSKKEVSRTLTDNAVISPNALGERLGNDKVVEGLGKIFEYTVARSKTKVFDNSLGLKPVFYDWMYITKSGEAWQICNEMPRGDNFHGFKIGVGNDWNSKSIVSLVFHGQEHPNDNISFQRELWIDDAPGIINIPDRGPFDTKHLGQISKEGQYFIIRLKKNLRVIPVHLKKHSNEDFVKLSIASKPKIKLLQSGFIRLLANPELGDLKFVKFQYNNEKSGRFETIELISDLPLDTIDIIELSAQRWRATETEFNILQHSFGFEKLLVRDPTKVWPLFLIAVICKSLFQRVLEAIHSVHGGSIDMSTFKSNLGTIIEHIGNGRAGPLPLDPCDAVLCPYRRKHGVRWR
ncbi:MAG: transposase [Nitrosopumilaceae archaeon]|nr:transposase [Nitrosopumilaceae archaeon]NIU02544.1 transposase [Nitrosopumilaceae archaeon]NIU89001.1 transposase [Nitrosopumilaceae archaeon]NIV67112.1 transposase [Nitrosopumilaceae archaeon]NIX63145.1 transposase [Nitrosopumilaceae archaeon]